MPTRFVWAQVRPENAQGRFTPKVFEVDVTAQGSYHVMVEEAIASIRAQGYETLRILDHSSRRETL